METNEVKVEKEDGKVKKLEKQVNGLCAVLRKLKGECEKHWGIDIDGDGKIGSIRMNALLLLLCVGVVAAVMAGDLVNYPTPSGGVGFSVSDAGNATVGGTLAATTVSATTVSATTLTGAMSAATLTNLTQTDTNATTTVTTKTPAFKGQILIGGAGTGTNGVWIAKGTTTNDWVQVAP
jgi:hypothetical protein